MKITVVGLLVLCGLIAGCRSSSVDGSKNYFGDERYPAQSADHPVELIPGETSRAHIVIGRVQAVEKEFWEGVYDATGDAAIAEVKKLAREMGGDAIIKFDTYQAPQGTVGEGRMTAQGIVVRWK